MSTTPTSDRVQLARYTTSSEDRVLYAWRTGPTFLLTDAPLSGDGREYIVERHVPTLEELRAIVLDYLGQTERSGDVPPADIRRLYPEVAS